MRNLGLVCGIDDITNMPDVKQYRTLIINFGEMHYEFPTTVHLKCGMNIVMFQFDHQNKLSEHCP
jgi:hypothetical protein